MPPTTRTKKPSHQCNHAVAGLRVMHSRRVIWFDQIMQGATRASIGRTYSEFLRRAYQLYGSAMAAARHLGRRSQNVVLRMVNSVREKVTQ